MLTTFTKGLKYIIKLDTGVFYIVQQSGGRTWTAFAFSHIYVPMEDRVVSGRAKELINKLPGNIEGFKSFMENYNLQVKYRKELFSILKKGRFEDE